MDEFAYHESLVHPPMLRSAFAGAPPKTVFIGGGGELATAREVLRHKTVERVVMVDIDGKVIEVCKKFLPEWGGEAVATDPRFELVIGDAYKWMMETDEMFDVIIMDISDPIEAGPGIMLYTKEFYEHVLTRLNTNGVFITQSGTADGIPARHQSGGTVDTSCYGPIHNTLRSVFDCVIPYSVAIPSYGGDWGFMMAFQAPAGTVDKALVEKEWKQPDSNIIDELIEKQIEGGSSKLGYYDSESHLGLFSLTKSLRNLLNNDKRIMTRDNPVFMY
jgi:spermidine synthase